VHLVFHDEHVAAHDALVQVLRQADLTRLVAGTVAGDREEVEGDGQGQRAGQVGYEEDPALQDGHEAEGPAGIVARDPPPELSDAPADLLAREDHLADVGMTRRGERRLTHWVPMGPMSGSGRTSA